MPAIVHLFVCADQADFPDQSPFFVYRGNPQVTAEPGSRAAAGRRQRTLDAGAPKCPTAPTITQAPAPGRAYLPSLTPPAKLTKQLHDEPRQVGVEAGGIGVCKLL
jgi:hypothetical protein